MSNSTDVSAIPETKHVKSKGLYLTMYDKSQGQGQRSRANNKAEIKLSRRVKYIFDTQWFSIE